MFGGFSFFHACLLVSFHSNITINQTSIYIALKVCDCLSQKSKTSHTHTHTHTIWSRGENGQASPWLNLSGPKYSGWSTGQIGHVHLTRNNFVSNTSITHSPHNQSAARPIDNRKLVFLTRISVRLLSLPLSLLPLIVRACDFLRPSPPSLRSSPLSLVLATLSS